jgi:hypothetical protein
MSDDVLTLTGQGPLSLQEFVRKNASAFTASARGLKCLRMLAFKKSDFDLGANQCNTSGATDCL